MKFTYDGFNWLVRLEKGELLIDSLKKLIQEQNLPSCWISGVGGAAWAEIGFYHLSDKSYAWKKLDTLLEITALQGNIAWEQDEVVLHVHGTFSDADMKAFGGHVKELEVAGTCELLLHKWYHDKLSRSHDPNIGLKLLDI